MPMGIRDLAMGSHSLGGAGGAQIGTFQTQGTVQVAPGQRLDLSTVTSHFFVITTRSGQSKNIYISTLQGLSLLGVDFQSVSIDSLDAGAKWALVSPNAPFTFPGISSNPSIVVSITDPTSGNSYPVYFTPTGTAQKVPASGVLRGFCIPITAGYYYISIGGVNIALGKATPGDVGAGTATIPYAIPVQNGETIQILPAGNPSWKSSPGLIMPS